MPEHKTSTTEESEGHADETSGEGRKAKYKEQRGRPQARRHVNELCQPYTSGSSINMAECEPLFSAFSLLQEKWIFFIIHSLLEGPVGFNELSRRAHGINTTTLTQRLMLLEQNGIVKRTVYSLMPPRTTYELTEAGLALREVIDAIARWGEHYRKDASPSCDPGEL